MMSIESESSDLPMENVSSLVVCKNSSSTKNDETEVITPAVGVN